MLTGLEVVAALIDAWNRGDSDQLVGFFADDYVGVDVAEPGTQHGLASIRRSIARYREAFPDLHLTASATVTQDNRVALFWVATGTHRGPLMHIPATGRFCEVRGVSLLRVEQGKIVEALHLWDLAGLLRSVGLLPDLSIDIAV
jgi:steroid delta-isomerase-like uncharacterized protein